MSELEKAKQIAAEAFNFKSKAYTTIEQQNEIIEVNRKAFMHILSLSSLTIPKSIAESNWMKHLLSCDLSQFEFERFDEFLNKEDEQFLKWVNTGKNENILYIYLAGKALGVDLVKVVEG